MHSLSRFGVGGVCGLVVHPSVVSEVASGWNIEELSPLVGWCRLW